MRSGDPIADLSSLTVFQVQHTASLGLRQQFTYGVDALWTRPDTKGTITGQNEDDDKIDEYGGYLQSETTLTDQLDLVLALRYDYHNRLEDLEASPRAALVFKPADTQPCASRTTRRSVRRRPMTCIWIWSLCGMLLA